MHPKIKLKLKFRVRVRVGKIQCKSKKNTATFTMASSSVDNVNVDDIQDAIMRFFARRDVHGTGHLAINGVRYSKEALRIWFQGLMEERVQILRIAAGLSMVHGHAAVKGSDMKQAVRIHKEGVDKLLESIPQQENINID